ncbi:hypothetical protein [Lederbergia panacisoli]|uniref:hypothetical protein n=1 Tax=Lederbergia panacisoli TaxID=1255251 RepID=UPI00214CC3EC|nr:hypothetical protein [Lederbergia panacisoli]MCR2822112.1 hypothetical protein [Lederbergia panacisoli]
MEGLTDWIKTSYPNIRWYVLPDEMVPPKENYWSYVAKCILEKGIEKYSRNLIQLEETDPECIKYPRFKKSDDKAGIVINF